MTSYKPHRSVPRFDWRQYGFKKNIEPVVDEDSWMAYSYELSTISYFVPLHEYVQYLPSYLQHNFHRFVIIHKAIKLFNETYAQFEGVHTDVYEHQFAFFEASYRRNKEKNNIEELIQSFTKITMYTDHALKQLNAMLKGIHKFTLVDANRRIENIKMKKDEWVTELIGIQAQFNALQDFQRAVELMIVVIHPATNTKERQENIRNIFIKYTIQRI